MSLQPHRFSSDAHLAMMLELLGRCRTGARARDFPGPADLQEALSLAWVREHTSLWSDEKGRVVAFGYVDGYGNLHFERDRTAAGAPTVEEIVACALRRLGTEGQQTIASLETSCGEDDSERIADLERCSFVRQTVRTLVLIRSLDRRPEAARLPAGFRLRRVAGEHEIEDLIALHRAAFGTAQMTVEERRAMMRAQGYDPSLDLLAVAPGGVLAAFCLCGCEGGLEGEGAVQTIGTHPAFRRRGLARSLLLEGLRRLHQRGMSVVRLGTSSGNLPMRRAAASSGFVHASTAVWFALPVTATACG